MNKQKKDSYSLKELAEATGLPPRTLRFYIARGVLPGPKQAGRNATYGKQHLKRLHQIKELKQKGLTLAAITQMLVGPELLGLPQESITWRHHNVSDDVSVLVREDCSPWRMRLISQAITDLQKSLKIQKQNN